MSDNPYGPPMPAPARRRGWPSWLVAAVGIVGGLVLLALPLGVLGLAIASDPHTDARSSAAAPGATAPTEPDPSEPAPSVQLPVTIDFPDGAEGTFTVPSGLEHDSSNDDDGHVALQGSSDDGPYVDVYADRTAASQRGDLAGAAARERSWVKKNGGTTTTVQYTTYAGQRVAQFTVHHPVTKDDPAYDELVSVLLARGEVVAIYWADVTSQFDRLSANADELSIVRSLDVAGGTGATDGTA